MGVAPVAMISSSYLITSSCSLLSVTSSSRRSGSMLRARVSRWSCIRVVSSAAKVPMGKMAPVRDVSRDVVGDPADGEVRIGVGEHDVDSAVIVEFANAEGGADARVAAADDDDPTQICSGSGSGSARMNSYTRAPRVAPASGAAM